MPKDLNLYGKWAHSMLATRRKSSTSLRSIHLSEIGHKYHMSTKLRMVLEPLGAFAVACNVIQVVEVGCKLVVGTVERVNNGSGLSNEHQELRDASHVIENLCLSLEASLPAAADTTGLLATAHRLIEANKECLRISREFLALLMGLKIKEHSSLLRALKMSFKVHWLKDKIQSIQNALTQARDNLNFALLLYVNSQQAATAQRTQDSIQDSARELEERITSVVESSSDRMQNEIRKLVQERTDISFDSERSTLAPFFKSNREILDTLSKKLESLCLSDQQNPDNSPNYEASIVQQKVLDSLIFPDMYQRSEQVADAQRGTYTWMLCPLEDPQRKWTCFYSWLQAPENPQRIYWVQGKPGSGKSTLLKFLDENLNPQTHMNSWCRGVAVYKAQFYFWSAGTTLQNSLGGMYRTILFQLLSQQPELIPNVLGTEKWRSARLSGIQPSSWTTSGLRSILQRTIASLTSSTKVFLLIDGLDELKGSSEEQEQLLDFLVDLKQISNLKICISSRPWNIFQDVLRHTPQLRLEDLTRDDIVTAVALSFEKSSRWINLYVSSPEEAKKFVDDIASKAHGVFLWVRLATRDLFRGITDGDSLPQLREKLSQSPGDLNEYFKNIINSIKPQYRKEASVFLQLAYYQDTEFISLYGLGLLELALVEEQNIDFTTRPDFDFGAFKLDRIDALKVLVDSTLRKLNSRCMGLLECTIQRPGLLMDAEHRKVVNLADEVELTDVQQILGLRVDFLHRSLAEFLTDPQMQNFLHSYTNGPFDSRRFLCNARFLHFITLSSDESTMKQSLRYGSYLLAALSVDGAGQYSAAVFTAMQTNLIRLAESHLAQNDFLHTWYILPCLSSWSTECGNPITIAIDFGLTSYVLTNLTHDVVREKKGRPILDYILRPRFIGTLHMKCGNRQPNIEMLHAALACGADPNERHHHEAPTTVWETFLGLWSECFLDVFLCNSDEERLSRQMAFTEALVMLLRFGARPVVGWWALATETYFERYSDTESLSFSSNDERFAFFWPDAVPLDRADGTSKEFQSYLVSSLLVSYKQYHDSKFDAFLEEVRLIEHNYIQKHALMDPFILHKSM